MPVCVHLRSLDVTAAKESDYVFQGSGSEETLVSEDRSLRPLWPRLLPLGGPQKTQILNLLSFYPQACWCILQRSLQGSGGEMPFSLILVPFNTLTAFLTPPPFFCLVTVFLLIAVSCWVPGGMPQTWCFKELDEFHELMHRSTYCSPTSWGSPRFVLWCAE